MIYFARWKIFTILGVCLFGLIFAAPNFLTAQQANALPSWVPSKQFSLGLDLQGGSHLLLEVQVNQVIKERLESLVDTMRTELRKARIRYGSLGVTATGATVTIKNAAEGEQARQLLRNLDADTTAVINDQGRIDLTLTEQAVRDRKSAAIEQS
ncbi:MAG TPA: protein translocase subunit SecD, partial [Rhodospirillales bacterium]|nr:protein translocase subunit SecD [Rhodospirillales bacterium]